MNINKILLLVAGVCVLIAAAIYAVAYKRTYIRPYTPEATSSPSTTNTVGTSSDSPAGEYTVQVHTITQGLQDVSITFNHVTYFEGSEASSSAAHDVHCKEEPLAACAPTLTKGYYVRPSSAESFTAAFTSHTKIVLRDSPNATLDELQNIKRQFDPVYEVQIQNGNIVSITEKSPL